MTAVARFYAGDAIHEHADLHEPMTQNRPRTLAWTQLWPWISSLAAHGAVIATLSALAWASHTQTQEPKLDKTAMPSLLMLSLPKPVPPAPKPPTVQQAQTITNNKPISGQTAPVSTPSATIAPSAPASPAPAPVITPVVAPTIPSVATTPVAIVAPTLANPSPSPSAVIANTDSTPKATNPGAANTNAANPATTVAATNSAAVVHADYKAAYLQNPEPSYPSMSRRMGEFGTVQLWVRVNTAGKVDELGVHKSSSYPRLDDAALKTVRDWRFTPAKRGNEAFADTVIVPISFKL